MKKALTCLGGMNHQSDALPYLLRKRSLRKIITEKLQP